MHGIGKMKQNQHKFLYEDHLDALNYQFVMGYEQFEQFKGDLDISKIYADGDS